jgi:hypothetical protein
MNADTPREILALTRHVASVKEAWRRHALAMTWEQKIAAIVRMRERQAAIRRARPDRRD